MMEVPMSKPLHIPHGATVLVCDAKKALFLKNRGDALQPSLQLELALQAEPNPATRD